MSKVHPKLNKRLPNARGLALQAFLYVADGAYAHQAFERAELSANHLDYRERRQARALFYTCLEHQASLSWILRRLCPQRYEHLDLILKACLLLGLAQLRYQKGAKPSAVCSEFVQLSRYYGHEGTAKFCNACLRQYLRQEASFASLSERTAMKEEMPETYEALAELYREGTALAELTYSEEAFWTAIQQALPLCLRVTGKQDKQETCKSLEEEGVVLKAFGRSQSAYWVETLPKPLEELRAWQEGACLVQGPIAQTVLAVVDVQEDWHCLDLCAAPGGKTLQVASQLKNPNQILAIDLYEKRLERLRENAQRLGLNGIKMKAADGTCALEEQIVQAEQFDLVLADVPCSSSGVLTKHPDLLSRFRRAESTLLATQASLLQTAAKATKPGALLVYSTCSIDRQENEAQVQAFLKSDLGASFTVERKDFGQVLDEQIVLLHETNYGTTFYPMKSAHEGFFVAYLRRRA